MYTFKISLLILKVVRISSSQGWFYPHDMNKNLSNYVSYDPCVLVFLNLYVTLLSKGFLFNFLPIFSRKT